MCEGDNQLNQGFGFRVIPESRNRGDLRELIPSNLPEVLQDR